MSAKNRQQGQAASHQREPAGKRDEPPPFTPRPPQKHKLLLIVAAALFAGWLLFLVAMALRWY